MGGSLGAAVLVHFVHEFECSHRVRHGQSAPVFGTAHTDVKRPEMWPKLNRGKATEPKAMTVVLISLDCVSPAHLAVKKNLTWAQGFRSKSVAIFLMFFF